jgi:predicted nucleotide-binding protein
VQSEPRRASAGNQHWSGHWPSVGYGLRRAPVRLLSSSSAPIQRRRRRASWIESDLVETNSERNSGFCNVQPSSLGFRLGSCCLPGRLAPVATRGERVKRGGEHAGPTQVFVIHGRNQAARRAVFEFLRSIGLDPIEWSQAIKMTGQASPYIGDVLDAAFGRAQAVVVLLTPDDVAYLHPSLTEPGDPASDAYMQPRPNVLFEAGIAMGRDPGRTVIVEFGQVKVFCDIHGRHGVHLNNRVPKRQDLAERLRTAGCAVNTIGTDWHEAGDLTPPVAPGGGLPLGRKLPKSQSSPVPRLDGRFIDKWESQAFSRRDHQSRSRRRLRAGSRGRRT